MTIALPDLPYAQDALEPHISRSTIEYHHGKHHAAYVTKTNSFLEGSDLAGEDLETIIRQAHKQGETALFNNAAQVWNHTFYWHSMSPDGGGKPHGAIARLIDESYDDAAKFTQALEEAALGQFGSGWAWAVLDGGRLKVVKTPNAANPLTDGQVPLLAIDVWEHAYYLDHQNRRPDYVHAILEHLINWDFANRNLEAAS